MGSLFGVPGMLWWGLAASIPILIHLFARQRYKRVPWAAMEFLLRAFKKTRRRIRLEHLLLLLLRILAILFFILALAEPLVQTSGLLGGSDRRRDVVIVLDDSFSMGLEEPEGGTPFGRARDQAMRLVRGMRAERGDTLTLVRAGRPASLELTQSSDLDRAAAEIEKIEVGDGATDLVTAFDLVVAKLQDIPQGAEIWLLSDLQKSAFQAPSEGVARGSEPATAPDDRSPNLLASLVQQMRLRQATLNIVAPRETSTDNLAAVGLQRVDKAAITGVPVRVAATIHNFGTRSQRGVVELLADGGSSPVESREVDAIAPGMPEVIDFRHGFPAAGSHNLEVRFVTDSLTVDNRRGLALEVRDRIRTMVVDGDPRSEPGEQESFFLSSALDPGAETARPVFAVEVTEETRFDGADLSNVDLLVLMNVGLISRKRAEDIQRFVEQGGGLLVFLGDRTQPQTMNSLLWKSGAGVLPAEILDPVGEPGRSDVAWTLGNADFEHPAIAYFNDPNIRGWLTLPPVYRFHRLAAGESPKDVRVLATFDRERAALAQAEPAILEKVTGKGKTILIGTSGDQDWTDLPAFPTYVLLVRELAYHLTRREARLENIVVGQSYQRILHGVVNEAVLSRDGEQLQIIKPLPLEAENGFDLHTPALKKAGMYRIDLSGQQGTRKEPTPIYVAVNVDVAESDLARAGEDFILATFPGDAVHWVQDFSEPGRAEGRPEGRAWWWAMLLALSALVCETALAQLFGLRPKGGAA